MGLEGELRVGLVVTDGRIAKLRIDSTRPDVAGALLLGRTRAELTAAVPRLYSVCGQSQAAACTLAGAAAAAEALAADELDEWHDAVATEILRDAAWRTLLETPKWLAEKPSEEAVLAGRTALGFRRDHPEDAASIAAATFGMPAAEWLAIDTISDLDSWMDAGRTVTARCQRRFRDDDACLPGANAVNGVDAAPPLLAARDHAAWLGEWLQTGEHDRDFWRHPTIGGTPAETGALARQQHEPLIAAILQRSVSRVPARFAARLHELARLLAGRQVVEMGTIALPGGEGAAWVENARGLLVHQVRLELNGAGEQARSTAYRIIAPTEWNFHPQGALAAALLGSPAPDRESLRRRAVEVVDSLDPCVGCRIEFDDA